MADLLVYAQAPAADLPFGTSASGAFNSEMRFEGEIGGLTPLVTEQITDTTPIALPPSSQEAWPAWWWVLAAVIAVIVLLANERT